MLRLSKFLSSPCRHSPFDSHHLLTTWICSTTNLDCACVRITGNVPLVPPAPRQVTIHSTAIDDVNGPDGVTCWYR
jgi:hypothetical protein